MFTYKELQQGDETYYNKSRQNNINYDFLNFLLLLPQIQPPEVSAA